ncbi:glycosyltransferase family 50 protein [Rhizoctonia solani AG-1 IA]|uniref:GPI mannosyltransferase 1 n=1 Tax=Thanatephorus cucumeris (strain AG1-IA) TaxID=983506 RepID=L8X4C5_THACA|nr:glycosyltransferase family 50 protein [Rhizoctonia solani AG-1 IA]
MSLLIFVNRHASLQNVIFLATVLRIGLLVYGDYHDRHSLLKYTDVDYRVFSDASYFIAHPSSNNSAQGILAGVLPWNLGEATYRYTPLLALLMVPNGFWHPAFGKAVFALCDLLVGIILYRISTRTGATFQPKSTNPETKKSVSAQQSHKVRRSAIVLIGALWLLNPMVANISTRGSAESVLGAMVIITHSLILSDRLDLAALMFGLSVHFKIYPIIYGASVLAWLDKQEPLQFSWKSLTRKRLRFTFISALSFLGLGGLMFAMYVSRCLLLRRTYSTDRWGHPFLEHTYLYHLTRRDHRHNFSPYFYPIYLNYDLGYSSDSLPSRILRNPLFSFVPQMGLCAISGLLLGRQDLSLYISGMYQEMSMYARSPDFATVFHVVPVVPALGTPEYPNVTEKRRICAVCLDYFTGERAQQLAEFSH